MKHSHEIEYSVLCICLKNIIAILIFVYFAFYFHRWWLVFPALLFQTGVKTSLEEVVTSRRNVDASNIISCDLCGEILYVSDIQKAVHREMKDNDWVRVEVNGIWRNLCPHCVNQYTSKKQKQK